MSDVLTLLQQYPLTETFIGILLLLLLAYVADRISKRVLLATISRIVRETSFQFDDVLLEMNVFGRIAHLAPAIAIYFGLVLVPGMSPAVATVVQHAAAAAMVLIVVSAIAAFLTAVARTYATSDIAQGRPVEAYIQIAKIAAYVVGIVLFISALTGRSPVLLLSGIGAAAAVLLLVFRDTILSFVASLQITSYDMLRVGDWIEMSQYGADGDVLELSLHTVKVQNWDKTITAIPTHKLIEQPFKNWRGMQESGGRRIKRALFVDMNSIHFLTESEVDRLENFAVLKDYLREKRKELEGYNEAYSDDPKLMLNARHLTNVGTFRAYLVGYLRRHPKIHQGMTLIIRQLEPGPNGLPIEIYAFTNTTSWEDYEDIQSDVFDHVLSVIGEFGLKVFQEPAGRDFAQLGVGRGEH